MGLHLSKTLPKDSLYEENRLFLEDAVQRVRSNDSETLHLDLSNRGIGTKGMEIAASCLHHNTFLVQLNLSHNMLGDYGVCCLVDALVLSPCALRTLNLGGNAIGASGCEHVAIALQKKITLEELSLYNNEIDDTGALALVRALDRACLSKLNLDMNLVTERTVCALIEVCEVNRRLQTVMVERQRWVVTTRRSARREGPYLRFLDAVLKLSHCLHANTQRCVQETTATQCTVDPTGYAKGNDVDLGELAIEKGELKKKHSVDVDVEKDSFDQNASNEVQGMDRDHPLEEDSEPDADERENKTVNSSKKFSSSSKRSHGTKTSPRSSPPEEYEQRVQRHTQLWKSHLEKARATEIRHGFTQYVRTASGDWVQKAESPRKLVACFCEPHDITAPYARHLHYHCKYEIDYRDSRNVDALSKKYEGCRGQAHQCASVCEKVKPVRNVSPMTFFASEHPMAKCSD